MINVIVGCCIFNNYYLTYWYFKDTAKIIASVKIDNCRFGIFFKYYFIEGNDFEVLYLKRRRAAIIVG